MTRPLQYTDQINPALYSEVIDVRSPGEYAEDHIPGAINVPILNNEERAEVGTLHAQVSPFVARKVGAALVSRNISQHLETHFAPKDRDYHPLIYCWRGGQRSKSIALVLAEIGWAVSVLTGGYKTYRHQVRADLLVLPQQFRYWVLCGATGSGKTLLLQRLAAQGAQVLDLEHLAQHRGSLLGAVGVQPSQKYFETLLRDQLVHLDPTLPVWVESESSKIGQVHLPKTLLAALNQSQAIEIQTPEVERVRWILQEYAHLVAQPEYLKALLKPLTPRLGHSQLKTWHTLIDQGSFEAFVKEILQHHYDPTYAHSLGQNFKPTVTIPMGDLSPQGCDQAVATLLALVNS